MQRTRTSESKRKDRARFKSENNILTIMKYVKESTKIATFLVITHLSLFREHEYDVLMPEAVRDILKCFEKMWIDIERWDPDLIRKLMTELQTRLTRLKVLQAAERESELKKSLMGKGSKLLKFRPPSTTKTTTSVNGDRDLSWSDKLDRNQIIEDDLERERLDKLNSGIKTGAQVWVSSLPSLPLLSSSVTHIRSLSTSFFTAGFFLFSLEMETRT
ncbi:hypothetical protein PSHT_12353 [Puccinia striiformis]|uniref:Uncharacterized protein n=1 Tax=Puccinia striiformis TaxID=27350 RepID=A0A2S4UX98_9BASI|nr:hypothetical protein PSHT_12353 [Puccinia striiformis]